MKEVRGRKLIPTSVSRGLRKRKHFADRRKRSMDAVRTALENYE
jgi:hypothetical protein